VDEANACIGLARLHTTSEPDAILARVQNDLFDLGADLCTPEQDQPKHAPLRVTASQVERLEREIDEINAELKPLKSFVLPGGTSAAAYLHLSRTVARRAERDMTRLAEHEAINPEAIRYINRLSDLLFVLARHLNDGGDADVLWQPGANR
jgi:cob(I)alamin adenosyltransferase